MVSPSVAPSSRHSWVTTSELLDILRISRSTLQRCGSLFRAGLHYRLANPQATRGKRLWNVAAVNQALLQASKRGRG